MKTQVFSTIYIIFYSLVLIFLFVSVPLNAQMKEGTIYYSISLDVNAEGISEEEIISAKKTLENKQFISFFNEDISGIIEIEDQSKITKRIFIDFSTKESFSFLYDYNGAESNIIYQHVYFTDEDKRIVWLAIENKEDNVEIIKIEGKYEVQGISCIRYKVLDEEGNEFYYYLSDGLIFSFGKKWNLSEHFSKLIVKVEIIKPSFTIHILLDKIIPGIFDLSWLSKDSTGVLNLDHLSQEFELLDKLRSSGNSENVEKLKCLDKYEVVEYSTPTMQYKPLKEVDIPVIYHKTLNHYSGDILKEIIEALRSCGLMSDALFSKYQQLVNQEEATPDEIHYFFGTHSIKEILQVPEKRKQLIQNLKTYNILNRHHKDEIDQKFLTADIDFSEYLVEMDFIRPYPRLNERVGFNEMPEIITAYFGTIFPEQKNNFATILQYKSEQPEYLIVFGQEHYIIEVEEFLPRSFFYTDVWSDTRKPLPDSFIVTPEIFSSLRFIGHQIAADIGLVLSINHVKTSAYFNGFREYANWDNIIQKHPGWSVFKHEFAIQIINENDTESLKKKVPIFHSLREDTDNTWLLHFEFLRQSNYPIKYLNSKKKQELTELILAEYPGIYVYALNSVTSPIPADGNICGLLINECSEYSIIWDARPHLKISEPTEFKDFFPYLYKRLGGVFNATIKAYEPTTGILTLETEKDKNLVKLGVHTYKFLELTDLINEQLAPEGKQFLLIQKAHPNECKGIVINKLFLHKYLNICGISSE